MIFDVLMMMMMMIYDNNHNIEDDGNHDGGNHDDDDDVNGDISLIIFILYISCIIYCMYTQRFLNDGWWINDIVEFPSS